MNQSFDIKELKRFCKRDEYIEHRLSVFELEALLKPACDNILNESFNFEIKRVSSFFLLESLEDRLILRKLNDNIKRIYKDEQANRKIIISQMKVLLEETCPCWIIKTDIKSFYESIDRNRLIGKFRDDSMLSYYSMFLLNRLFNNEAIITSAGVPRGMNISATLSEIYMRKFDKWIREYVGVYYYARFVDDIIIFTNSLHDVQHLIKDINIKLDELAPGLVINNRKTQIFNGLTLKHLDICEKNKFGNNNHLEYLGYKFNKIQNGKTFNLRISIADKKIKKIKTRIILSFMNYSNNLDFNLFNNRIRFITGNYKIKKTSEGNILKSGIYFNYPHLTDTTQLKELTRYYRKILYCKRGKLGKVLARLSLIQRNKLKKYCFVAGFENRIYKSFNYSQIAEIVRCW
jgi:ribonucleotide reductase beta subunit family protein with ferritin-like domain